MTDFLHNWFSANQITNEISIQTAKTAEKLLNPNYNCLVQLSTNNLSQIRDFNEHIKSYNQLNFEQIAILSEAQLKQTEYLLAGDAGEQLVDQAVQKLANPTKIIFHNVLLPYQYGSYGSNYDNQIDSLVITETGIYCIEVKVRNVKGSIFNFEQLEPSIYDQLTFHKEAVLQALKTKANINPKMVKTIVVVINRNGTDNFRIINDQELERAGAKATTLKCLDLVLSNGFGQDTISPGQIIKINQAIWSNRITDKRTYPLNIRFNLNTDSFMQLNLATKYQIPVSHIITYNAKLNDCPLTGLNSIQQNFFWLIVGNLYSQKESTIELSRKKLAVEAGYCCKDFSRLDQSLAKLAKFMQATNLFNAVYYESGKMIVSVKKKYMSLFSYPSYNFTFWNYQLLKRIINNPAKTLFRKLVQYAATGCYHCPFSEFRQIMGIPSCYSNSDVLKRKVDPAIPYLTPLFKNLRYEIIKRGKEKKISDIKFTFDRFDPEILLSPCNWNLANDA